MMKMPMKPFSASVLGGGGGGVAGVDKSPVTPKFGMLHKDSARPVYLQERAQAYKRRSTASSSCSSLPQETTPLSQMNGKTGTLEAWRQRQEEERERIRRLNQQPSPPERPPKKAHLRSASSGGDTPPPATPPRGHTPIRSSSSASSSRGATPVSYSRSSSFRGPKPKFPSPPGSPALKGRGKRSVVTPSPPPPPPPSSLHPSVNPGVQGATGSSKDFPLPPPPVIEEESGRGMSEEESSEQDIDTLRICDSPLKIHDSPAASNNNNSHGVEGKYRRTSSPAVCVTPNLKPSASSNALSGAENGRTPKRGSPATIAAKGAPGWEKFLGGKTSTIQFTSEEVSKIKLQQQQRSPAKPPMANPNTGAKDTPPAPPPKPKMPLLPLGTTDQNANSSFMPLSPERRRLSQQENYAPSDKQLRNGANPDLHLGMAPIHSSKSSPNLNNSPAGPQTPSGLKAIKKRQQQYQSQQQQQQQNVWKTSLDSLRVTSNKLGLVASPPSVPRGGVVSNGDLSHAQHPGSNGNPVTTHHHSHSNSDSGLSSLSGRTSTMSPISTMSTVSSVSSASSSASSRASLRSGSIVSTCTIPLDEEEEEEELGGHASMGSSPAGTLLHGAKSEFRHIHPASKRNVVAPGRSGSGRRRGHIKRGRHSRSSSSLSTGSTTSARERLPEETECDNLAKSLLGLCDGDGEEQRKLNSLFGMAANTKSTADFMEGLFDDEQSPNFDEEDEENLDEAEIMASQSAGNSNRQFPAMMRELNNSSEAEGINGKKMSTFQENKAKFMAREEQSRQHNRVNNANSNNGTSTNAEATQNPQQLKNTLISCVSRKLEALKSEQVFLKDSTKKNEELGRTLIVAVMQRATPNECDKYKLHVEEVDKITSLLFGLSGRLAKAENNLLYLPNSATSEEKDLLTSKRDKLSEQLEEAKNLRENIEKRSRVVSEMLRRYLTSEGATFAEYQHFIRSKARLIMNSREVAEKIANAEEQLSALKA